MPYQRAILSFQQLVFFLGFGIAGWLIAALLLRFLGPMGIYDGGARVLTYALIIPGTVPFIWLAAWLGGAREGQLFLGFSISTAMAMLEHFSNLLSDRGIALVVCGIEDELQRVMTGSGLRRRLGAFARAARWSDP